MSCTRLQMSSSPASDQNGKRKITSSGRSSRVVTRLQQAMKSGKYYEAHQTVRVLYQRYSAQNRDKDATEMLHTGARFLLQHRQVTMSSTFCFVVKQLYSFWSVVLSLLRAVTIISGQHFHIRLVVLLQHSFPLSRQ